MSLIIDSHAHVFPNLIRSDLLGRWRTLGPIGKLRQQARAVWKPFASSMHHTQTFMRHLPDPVRRKLDALGGLTPLPGLLVESTLSDLTHAMDAAGVHSTVIIAHPPHISNEFVMEIASRNPRLIPVVNLAAEALRPTSQLKSFVKHGAKALKIHPAADGEGPDSPRYAKLLKAAGELGLPVIVHTGCIHSHVLYKKPEFGHAAQFSPWFKLYPETKFILAHMNFHEPHIAFDLAEQHLNVYMDTSWQPAEVIGEAVRRLGADRILFGTDWPFVGGNIQIGLARIRECVEAGTLTEAQANQIRGENAAKLWGITPHAT